jgi:hypothetical protein
MNPRVTSLILTSLGLAASLEAVTTLQDTRNFFPEHEEVPVGADVGMPNYYYGSDLYSVPVEGPIWPRYSIELESSLLFFLGRDASKLDGKYLHHGFNFDIGMPLSRKMRPNHYLNLELFAGYDSLETTGYDIEVDSYSLLINYKWYTPPMLRERIFPHIQVGVGNTFMKIKDDMLSYNEWDSTIFTLKGTAGIRTRLTEHVGVHTGYHLVYIGDNHKKHHDSSGDLHHALDLGLSLIF